MKVLSIVAIGSSVVFFGFGCKETQSPENKVGKNVLFDLQVGEISIQTELALLPEERLKGLMHRDRLDEGKGMFFIFEKASAQRFWMKNTKIPLDIGYFSPDGRLKELHNGKPFDLSGMPSSSNSLQFVIELNAGAYKKLGIRMSDKIDLSALAIAITKSGQDPNRYGL